MPPKRAAASSSKRKLEESEDEESSLSSSFDTEADTKATKAKATKPQGKKAKKSPPPVNDQPTNKVLPVKIQFPEKNKGCVRIATWNICGLAAAQKKGFKYYVEAEDADVLILTETKVNNPPVDPELTARYPHRYWSISDKKTYSGTAILSKIEPLSVDYTLPGHPDPKSVKGRIVTLEFSNLYVIGTYVVNAGTGLKTLDAKNEWNKHFEVYIRELDKKKPVIWAGDLNVAPTELGMHHRYVSSYAESGHLANPKTNWNKTPGYTEAETSSFARILNPPDSSDGKFVDVWRNLHPEKRHYTYFSYRFNCREKGIGWRLDTFVTSERLTDKVKMCEIRSEIYGASDHCPVVLEIEGDL
ncbi:hypothetical protein K474DRAFT_1632758 [Panus rudis PR-1116 ss-1]|nr:hypothetical protein K474DRAFT_1632758 [Panus rudis PR-1116 ss-1]